MDTPYSHDPIPDTVDEQYLSTLCSANAAAAPSPSLSPSPLLSPVSAADSARAKLEARKAARLAAGFKKLNGEQAAAPISTPALTEPAPPIPVELAPPLSEPSPSMVTASSPVVPAAPSFAPAAAQQRALSRRQREEQDRRDRASELLASLGLTSSGAAQMSRADLAAVLEVLLSADEDELRRLHDRPDTPTSLKTIIRRVLADMQSGSLKALQSLWDRLYGRAPLTAPDTALPSVSSLSSPAQSSQQALQDVLQGVLPQTPVSREAYIVIRDTLMR